MHDYRMHSVWAVLVFTVFAFAGESVTAEPTNPFGLPGEWTTILRQEMVVKELGLSQQQNESIQAILIDKATTEDSRKKIGQVLNTDQLTQLKQISWQISEGFALFESEVAKRLELKPEQQTKISDIAMKAFNEMQDFLTRARFRSPEALEKFKTESRDAAGRQLLEVLSAEQRQKFDSLLGK